MVSSWSFSTLEAQQIDLYTFNHKVIPFNHRFSGICRPVSVQCTDIYSAFEMGCLQTLWDVGEKDRSQDVKYDNISQQYIVFLSK
jgi:hypothetical protein